MEFGMADRTTDVWGPRTPHARGIVLSVLLVTVVASGANILAAVRQSGVTDAPRPHGR
jgi:hypothetical protein